MGCPLYFPDLLEEFMSTCNDSECWITVQEFRETMSLDTTAALALSGFLRRLYNNRTVLCRYTVVRIENVKVDHPYKRIIRRYLVRKRPTHQQGRTPERHN